MQRRFLVLTDESARHPFRASLAPHVLRDQSVAPRRPRLRRSWMISGNDWRDFFAAYCAAFVAVFLFIA